jgi:hypothetical protein
MERRAAPPKFLAPAMTNEDQPDDEPAAEPMAASTSTPSRVRHAPRRVAPASKIQTNDGNGILAQILEFIRVMTGSDSLTQRAIGVATWAVLAAALLGGAFMIWVHPNPASVVGTVGLAGLTGSIAWLRKMRKKS